MRGLAWTLATQPRSRSAPAATAPPPYSLPPRDRRSDSVGFRMRREKVSHMLPTVFQERIIRVYSKDPSEAVVIAVQAAFRHCLRRYK